MGEGCGEKGVLHRVCKDPGFHRHNIHKEHFCTGQSADQRGGPVSTGEGRCRAGNPERAGARGLQHFFPDTEENRRPSDPFSTSDH